MKYIIFISLLIFSFTSQAVPTCSKNGTTVIYTNGVITSRKDADIAKEKLKALSLDSQIDLKPEKVNYDLAYNFSESPAKDFLEAAVQRFPASYLTSQGVSNGYAAFMGFLNGGLANAIYDVALNSIVNQYLEIQSNWIRDNYNQPQYIETLQKIKGLYEIALNNGERVFAISHSQGGLFMRDAFDQIIFANKKKVFSGFQIASPLGSEMSGHFGYATHDKDRLINFIRGTVGALNANVVAPAYIVNDNTGNIKDDFIEYYINHGILTTYLYDTPVQFNEPTIRSQVISELIKTAQLLESNCPKAVINYTKNNLQVNFDSTDPEDPNVTGLTYSWNFGDGNSFSTLSKAFSHTYATSGTYNVSLTVTDAYGASDTVQANIQVIAVAESNKEICNYGETDLTFNFTGLASFTLKKINRSTRDLECKIIQPGDISGTRLTITSSDTYTPYYSIPLPSEIVYHYESVAPFETEDYTLPQGGNFSINDGYMYAAGGGYGSTEYPNQNVWVFKVIFGSTPRQALYFNITYK